VSVSVSVSVSFSVSLCFRRIGRASCLVCIIYSKLI
jgi:hypothetical protein